MNGLHIPGTPIVVDFWKLRQIPPRALCFLTHMHADHTSGLTSSWPYPIHCTPTTAKLLIRKFNINPKLVVELEVGDSRILHVNCPGSGEHVGITVTVFDANHCPGSAMFLFQGYFGSVLYTGDFRLSPTMLSHPVLNGSQTIDVLYLDNTYCHPSCQFPSREDAAEQVVALVRDNPEFTTVIGMHTLGKEDLLVHIATTLECWVGVSQERYDVLKLLEQPNVFKTDMKSCAVRVYPFHQVAKEMPVGLDSDDLVQILLPTCLYIGSGAPHPPAGQFTTVVPYSDHCSFSELWQFVTSVRPRRVRPIVRHFTGDHNSITISRTNMSIFDKLLDPTSSPSYEVPESIQRILCMRAHDHVPHPYPIINRPALRKSHSLTPPNSKILRNRPRGVQFISPSKHKPANSTLAVQSDNQTSNSEAQTNSPPEHTAISRKVAEVREECDDNMHEEEVCPSNLVNPRASLQQHTDECMAQVHFTNSTIDSSKLLVETEHKDGTKTTAKVEKMAENTNPRSVEGVETNSTGMENHPLPKLASSDDLDLFYGSGLSKLGVKRKLPPSIHSSSNKAVSLSPGSQTPLTRFFSSAVTDDTSDTGIELLERLKSFDLKSPAVLSLLDSALQQAAQLISTSPVVNTAATSSAPLSSVETEEEEEEKEKEEGLGDLDTKLMGNNTSEAERQLTRCTCGETDRDEVCFIGLEKFFVKHDHQSTKDFERWLQNL